LDEISDVVLFLCDACNLTPASRDEAEICRPYDRRRAGLVAGDGAVFFVLEKLEFARARNAKVYGYLQGYASVTDRRSADNPAERNLEDTIYAINSALRDAGVTADKISLVSGAANGSRSFDEIEAQAIARVFPHNPPVFAGKAALGETWGAAGGLAVLCALLAAEQNLLPPTAGTSELAQDCPVNVALGEAVSVEIETMLALSFDMTGQNTAFVLSKNL